jgi:hypothetical protein
MVVFRTFPSIISFIQSYLDLELTNYGTVLKIASSTLKARIVFLLTSVQK